MRKKRISTVMLTQLKWQSTSQTTWHHCTVPSSVSFLLVCRLQDCMNKMWWNHVLTHPVLFLMEKGISFSQFWTICYNLVWKITAIVFVIIIRWIQEATQSHRLFDAQPGIGNKNHAVKHFSFRFFLDLLKIFEMSIRMPLVWWIL